jgi:hypothetical protein
MPRNLIDISSSQQQWRHLFSEPAPPPFFCDSDDFFGVLGHFGLGFGAGPPKGGSDGISGADGPA